jgi:hypothetical protein
MAWNTRALFVCSLLASAWLSMQLVHEFGHVLAAWATGGTVQRVIFHPLAISRTDVSPNPSPLVVAWAGPIVGSLLPALAAGICRGFRLRVRLYAEFFAGFCLVANGLYIGVGSFEGVGDAGDLLRLGAQQETLLLFGAIAFALGVWMWHRASGDFGFGRNPRVSGRIEATVAAATAVILTIIAAVFGSRD